MGSWSPTYFSPDYFTARDRFRTAVKKAGGRLEVLPLDCNGPGGEELGIDIAWFGVENPRCALLHSSGLHGVEGFAGSAIQLQLLENLPALFHDAALVVAHILNPYGMAWLRRVNENNVDLNRNFRVDEKYAGAPAAYDKLDSFLNPASPPALDFFLPRAAWLVARYGMPALKQSMVGGQYDYLKGLFFGGKRLEQGPAEYRAFVNECLAPVRKLVIIDVHTGLGKYGEDTLLVDSKDYPRLQPIFGERVKAMEPEQGPAYRVRGGLPSIFHALSGVDSYFVGQEFGTYSPMKVLHALREENRWHHHGGRTFDHPARRALKKAFCPDDETWRRAVLARGRDLLAKAIESFFPL